jgi:two-component system KDP operon response regulator KdpE
MSASLISSNVPLRKQLRALLEPEGFKVWESATPHQAADQFRHDRFRLVIFDLDPPAPEHHETLRTLKKASRAPLIALSRTDHDADVVKALEYGADDFIVTPFNASVLLARIHANLRMLRPAAQPVDKYLLNGPIRIDPERHEVRVRGRPIAFSPKAFEILRRLVARKGEALANRDLLREVWGEAHGNHHHYLRVYMSQIRKKLEPAGLQDTISGSRGGYMMDVLAEEDVPALHYL